MRLKTGIRTALLCVTTLCLVGSLCASAQEKKKVMDTIPYPDALEAASLQLDRLDDLLDDSLIIGNGDINALVWTDGGATSMILTKNDVWDARLDTVNDPPLPTLKRIKGLSRAGGPIRDPILPEGVEWSGRDSYHAHPYPCPRACARLVFGTPERAPTWRCIRAQGELNEWQRQGEAAVMSIRGRKEASNGYALSPLDLNTDDFLKLRVRVSGSENARHYVDVMTPDNNVIFGSKWIDSTPEVQEHLFDLPPGRQVGSIILYTMTMDGKRVENRFEHVAFEGGARKHVVDLDVKDPPTCGGRLDIRRAAAHVHGAPDAPAKATVRALAGRNVFLVQSTAKAKLVPIGSGDIPPASQGETNGVAWLRQDIPGDLDWPGMSFAVALASRGDLSAVAIATSLESKDVVADAVALARGTAEANAAALIAEHEAEWERFWSRSGVEIDDSLLQDTWYLSLYFLRCVSKPGVVCPGLFASLINDTPAWHGDYHTNYNIQQTFWGAYAANHAELAEPYDRLIREYLPRAQWLAREIFSTDGAFYPHVLFAYEPPDPTTCKSRVGRQYIHHTWGMTLGVTGFSVQPLWWHYKYEPDRELLEETVYPPVREAALFYAEFIEQCEGTEAAVLSPTVSPEHWGWTPKLERNRNCAFDIAMIRYTLNAAIEGAEVLGRDEELAARFRNVLKRLPPYPLHGEKEPIVVDVEGAPPINYNIAVPATPVFPCDVVTWRSPAAERELFARTIRGINWNGNNSTVILAIARARLNMPGSRQWLRDEIAARLRPNGTLTLNRLKPHHGFNDFGHYTEQFGAAMGVSELMLQSVGGVIRVLPALGPDCKASFSNLRTEGGFLVSASGDSEAVATLEIVSTAGGKLRLLSPWKTTEASRNGEAYQKVARDAEGIVEFATRPGDAVRLRPAGQ